MPCSRRSILAQATGLALAASLPRSPLFAAPAWKVSGPIRLIVPYPPGGGTDVAARLLAAGMKDRLGHPLIVENRPGANGVIAANMVYEAKPDGLTWLFGVSDIISTTPNVNPKIVKFDATRYCAVAPVGRGGYVLATLADHARPTLQEVLAEIRAPGSRLTYGHWGPGSMSQMAMEQFKLETGIPQLTAIPFGGSAAVLNAVLGGHIDYAFITPNLAAPNRDKLKMYAVSSAERIPLLPDLPTLKELGYRTQAETLYGVFAPPGTPEAAIRFFNDEILRVTGEESFIKRLVDLGYAPIPMTPQEMGAYVRAELKQWGELVRQTHIQVD